MDVLFFYFSSIYITEWICFFLLMLVCFAVLSLLTEDWKFSLGLVVAAIFAILVGYSGYAILSSEISKEDYQKVLTLKKQAQDGKSYTPEANQALLHIIKLSTSDKKINEFEFYVIEKTKESAIKKTYISKVNN